MKHWVVLILSCWGVNLGVVAQEINQVTTTYVDSYEQHYQLKGNTLIRSNSSQGNPVVEFTDFRLGELKTVNISNPLSLVLLYEKMNTIVVVDNQLNKTAEIDGNKIASAVQLICAGWADQNQLWIYDRISQRIGLLDWKKMTIKWISRPFEKEPRDLRATLSYFYFTNDDDQTVRLDLYGRLIPENQSK